MSITIQNINKHFGSFHALQNIRLEVPTGKLVSLLGPSGCGKTTLLRIIAGLENADGGQILFDGQDVTRQHVRERKVGFVFQHYALFRHMNVADNIAFGLTVLPHAQRPSKARIREKVAGLLNLVQLEHLAKSYPHQISGGQRQRIALARALAVEPKLLLLDEPFGALDAKVRKELRTWLRQLHHELGITSILVTHDQEEALEISDPFEGRIERGQWHYRGYAWPLPPGKRWQEQSALGYIRPHEWQIDPERPMLRAAVESLHHTGALTRLTLREQAPNGQTLQASFAATEADRLGLAPGQILPLAPRQVYVFSHSELIEYAR